MKIKKEASTTKYKDLNPGDVFETIQSLGEGAIFMVIDEYDSEGVHICVDLEDGTTERFQPYINVRVLQAHLEVGGYEI